MYEPHAITDLPVYAPTPAQFLPAPARPAAVAVPERVYSTAEVYQIMQSVTAPQPVQQPVQVRQADPWPARLLAGGAGGAMLAGTLGAVAPQLVLAGHAVEMAGFGVGAALAGLALLKGRAPHVNVSITNNNTGSTATAGSSSAAGWHPTAGRR